MSTLFHRMPQRLGLPVCACWLAAVSLTLLPVLSMAQDPDVASTDPAPAAANQEDSDVDEGEVVVEAAQVIGGLGIEANKMIAAKRFQLTQIFLVEVDELERICELDKKQVLKLRIGAKGAVKKMTAEWKKLAQEQMGMLRQVAQANGVAENGEEGEEIEIKDADEIDENTLQMVMMNGMGNPFKFDDPIDHRFWQTTLSNVLTEAQAEKVRAFKAERKRAKRNAMIESVSSTLTIELGLTDDQRVKLAEILRPPMEKAEISCWTFYEPFVLYYHASKTDENKLKELLSPAQLQKWKIFVSPSKQIGEMMEDEVMISEEDSLWIMIDRALQVVVESVQAVLNLYSK